MSAMKVSLNRSSFVYAQILSLFSIILLLLSLNYLISVFASTEKSNGDDNKGVFNLNIKMNLNNIQLKDGDKIKIVAYVNGETGIQYLDPQKEKDQITGNFLTADMKFNKTNEISSIKNDEYFVCAYVLSNGQTKLSNINNTSAITYDCDEGQTVKGKEDSGDVKITVITPIYDQTDVDLLNVIAMVKGDYQVKTVNIEAELKKAGDKSDESYIIQVPFTFDRNTELGTIEKGDIFFGCASAEELGPPQMTECEKKYLKDFDKPN